MDLDSLVPSMISDAWITEEGFPYNLGAHQFQVDFEAPASAAHLEGLGFHLLRNDPTSAMRSFDKALQEYERLEKKGNSRRDLCFASKLLLLNLREVFLDGERDIVAARWCLEESLGNSSFRDLVAARKWQTEDHDRGRMSAHLLRFIRKLGV